MNTPQPTPPAAPRGGLVTCAEAQTFLSISRSTLHRLTRREVLRPVRIGRALRYRAEDLQAIVEKGGVK